jgi:hypothetical protein
MALTCARTPSQDVYLELDVVRNTLRSPGVRDFFKEAAVSAVRCRRPDACRSAAGVAGRSTTRNHGRRRGGSSARVWPFSAPTQAWLPVEALPELVAEMEDSVSRARWLEMRTRAWQLSE